MEEIRLQKYFTDCGIMSRRAAEKEIADGKVKVNGVVAELGQKIDPEVDEVTYLGKPIKPRQNARSVCIMLNKPRGYVTTMSDEKGRRTVRELVSSLDRRVYPVGRLDMDSDGLLLMTDDGELANMLTHPKHQIPKIYHVTVLGKVDGAVIEALGQPMDIDGYTILPVRTELLAYEGTKSVLRMELYEGRNRQIRKMCESQGLKITRLTRIAIGEIGLGELKIGHWRHLSKEEIDYLKANAQRL